VQCLRPTSNKKARYLRHTKKPEGESRSWRRKLLQTSEFFTLSFLTDGEGLERVKVDESSSLPKTWRAIGTGGSPETQDST
jgi:hypothetical protein